MPATVVNTNQIVAATATSNRQQVNLTRNSSEHHQSCSHQRRPLLRDSSENHLGHTNSFSSASASKFTVAKRIANSSLDTFRRSPLTLVNNSSSLASNSNLSCNRRMHQAQVVDNRFKSPSSSSSHVRLSSSTTDIFSVGKKLLQDKLN